VQTGSARTRVNAVAVVAVLVDDVSKHVQLVLLCAQLSLRFLLQLSSCLLLKTPRNTNTVTAHNTKRHVLWWHGKILI